MTVARVHQIERFSLTVADLGAARAFYVDALGFQADGRSGSLLGPTGAPARTQRLTLGAEQLELIAFDPPGRPYPTPHAANDPDFQHFAIAVSDMDAAYDRLRRATGMQPIS